MANESIDRSLITATGCPRCRSGRMMRKYWYSTAITAFSRITSRHTSWRCCQRRSSQLWGTTVACSRSTWWGEWREYLYIVPEFRKVGRRQAKALATSTMNATSIHKPPSNSIEPQHSLNGGSFVPPKFTHSAAN